MSVVLVDGLNVDFSGFAGEAMRQLIKRFLNVIRVQIGSVYRGILGENVAYFVHSLHIHSIHALERRYRIQRVCARPYPRQADSARCARSLSREEGSASASHSCAGGGTDRLVAATAALQPTLTTGNQRPPL